MTTVTPTYGGTSFNCPICNAYAKMDWKLAEPLANRTFLEYARCQHCHQESIWLIRRSPAGTFKSSAMIYPDIEITVLPATDMPDNVKQDFNEAKSIFNKSPKAAAALLRLALQKLCKHLGEPGKNINQDIHSLVEKNILNAGITKAADTVRITGNNAVHPGEMNDEDIDLIASKMFDLINFIVVKTITEPKELDALYTFLPEGARDAVEKRDTSPK